MSHFAVLVIGPDFEKQLAPYHEFECTGIDDQYVQDIDRTAEIMEEYNTSTKTMLQGPDGSLHNPLSKQFHRTSATVKDFAGKPMQEQFIPEGYVEVVVPTKEIETFVKWAQDEYGWKKTTKDTLDTSDKGNHKYGYILVDDAGNVLKCIDRTNPNKKWDWYQVGGRWVGFFKVKPTAARAFFAGSKSLVSERQATARTADKLVKGDVDVESMRDAARMEAAQRYDKLMAAVAGRSLPPRWEDVLTKHGKENIEAARKEYWADPVLTDMKLNKDLWWEATEIDDFRCTREEFMARAEREALVTFAFVRDGKWYERGEMGWWGAVFNEKDKEQWAIEFNKMFDELPDDTELTLVDCHI
jgi:hypothetical protein